MCELYSQLLTRSKNTADDQVDTFKVNQLEFVREVEGGQLMVHSATGKLVIQKTSNDASQMAAEARLLKTLRHPNIAQLMGFISMGRPCMYTEFSSQTLADYIRQELTDADCMNQAQGVSRGLQYLAARQVVHRQLKADNCFLSDSGTVKIGGFGKTRQFIGSEDYQSSSSLSQVDFRHMAPESVRERKFSKASDIYCLGKRLSTVCAYSNRLIGILFFELFHRGQHPHHALEDSEYLQAMASGNLPSISLSHAALSGLFKKMFAVTAQGRPTATQVVDAVEDIASGQERWEFSGDLTFIRELGSGQFGTVDQMVAHDLPVPGESTVVAVKTLLSGSSAEAEEEFFAEV